MKTLNFTLPFWEERIKDHKELSEMLLRDVRNNGVAFWQAITNINCTGGGRYNMLYEYYKHQEKYTVDKINALQGKNQSQTNEICEETEGLTSQQWQTFFDNYYFL